jgi:hypothetical protein
VILELHPEATKNFDARADGLLTKLTPDPYAQRSKREGRFMPDIFIREVEFPVVNKGYSHPLHGREIAKTFQDGEEVMGLFDEGYKDLVRLAEKIQKAKTIRDKVSVKTLTELIFKWVSDRHRRLTDLPMTRHVLPECEGMLREAEIWVPVATLHIQSGASSPRRSVEVIVNIKRAVGRGVLPGFGRACAIRFPEHPPPSRGGGATAGGSKKYPVSVPFLWKF